MNHDFKRTERTQHRIIYIVLAVILASCLTIWLFISDSSCPRHVTLELSLLEQLVSIKPLPCDFNKTHPHLKKIIYVLGGNQSDLGYRFKAAAALYRDDISQKILIGSDLGITEYDPQLKRNMTSNEWAIKRLMDLRVKKKDVELLQLRPGLFGTLREARTVAQEFSNQHYDILILVSSPYHTRRVYETFSKSLNNKGIEIFVYASEDRTNLFGLLTEYIKLVLYEKALLR